MYLTVSKTIVILLTLWTTSGCSLLWQKPLPPREVEIKTVSIQIPITQPTLPRAIDLKEPVWYVVSNKNLDEFIARMEKESGAGLVFVAMSVSDYELMAYNMQEIKRYVRELKEVVIYYRTVTLPQVDKKEEILPENVNEQITPK